MEAQILALVDEQNPLVKTRRPNQFPDRASVRQLVMRKKQDRNLTGKPVARKPNHVYSERRHLVSAAMIPTESPAKLQTTEAATRNQNDGFLYQCRVSPKISACVGGNRNGEGNSFCRIVRKLPGNETVVDLSNRPRVPVHNSNQSKASINPHDGYQPEPISSGERV